MFKILKFIKSVALLNKKLNNEEEHQKKEGYFIDFIQEGPERCITYIEGENRAYVIAEFSWLNDVTLYTESFLKWDKPNGEELTSSEHRKVLNRLVRHFSCWGGEVILDDSPMVEHIDY